MIKAFLRRVGASLQIHLRVTFGMLTSCMSRADFVAASSMFLSEQGHACARQPQLRGMLASSRAERPPGRRQVCCWSDDMLLGHAGSQTYSRHHGGVDC